MMSVLKLCKQFNNLHIFSSRLSSTYEPLIKCTQLQANRIPFPLYESVRSSHSFLSRTTANQLWKGVTSVSPAGRRKGRGRGSAKKTAKDLNRGQVIGFGKKNMIWPGLNSPIIQGKEIFTQQELPPDDSRLKHILEMRTKFNKRKSVKIHPLERGWSGTKLGGRSLGPPDPIGEEKFEGFDSKVLMFKPVMHMTGKRGRVRSFQSVVVTGNKNGLAGFAIAKSKNGATTAKQARNKAAQNLRYIERDNNTVLHDFVAEYGPIKIFVKKKPPGYGLTCQRVIKAICEMLGIKDLHAKCEGPTQNTITLTRAFFIGLMTQKKPQQIAEEKGLHIVELRPDRDYFPRVVASPQKCRTQEEISPTEQLDFNLHLYNGKVEQPRKKFEPFYVNFPSYIKAMKYRAFRRNQRQVKIELIAKYGDLKSFLTIREEEKAKQKTLDVVEE